MGKYFDIKELCHSNTAKQKKIDNTPTREIEDNLNTLIDSILDPVRERYGSPIRVSSGFRSKALNKAVNGANNSQHLFGEAADLIPYDLDVKALYDLCLDMIEREEISVGQLINEYNFSWVHVSLPTENHRNEIIEIKPK